MTTKSLFNTYASDTKMEKDGKWCEFHEAGVSVLIARAGGSNHKFRVAEMKMYSETDPKTLAEDPDKYAEKLADVYAECVVLDIKGEGFVDEEGNPATYTAEVGASLLKQLPDFFEEVRFIASQRSTFRKERDKAIAGN
ncbi:tape measure chaperone [Stenotrophomonas phage Siara]|uniref:Tape measure chaperone n=1 Tax=Stenotrophomonas phage Siara TaxID=2859658 RepID=A0AAE7WM75_9CAUD|nr:tape measure chaperone [Stenotrophomonas phage Siara]QYW02046.1 tape measure chaperone [Stenotrophomonas phage Siara]